MPNNAETLLSLTVDELNLKVAKRFVPKPWKHAWFGSTNGAICRKCYDFRNHETTPKHCTVPDRINTTDWNVAMKLRDVAIQEYGRDIYLNIIRLVVAGDKKQTSSMFAGIVAHAQPRHYTIAAMLAAGKEKQ